MEKPPQFFSTTEGVAHAVLQGTPEARKLKKHLRLQRDEVDYLRLHELATFTQTDLRQNAKLRGLLEQCDCGHLFELADEGFRAAAQGVRRGNAAVSADRGVSGAAAVVSLARRG